MSGLDRYLMRAVIMGSLLALLVLGILDWVFSFLGEIGKLGHGGMDLIHFVIYTLYGEPKRLYELFPTAVLVGALLNLGKLAAQSELIAMRALGLSVMRIFRAMLYAGILLVMMAFLLGEFVAPVGERAAHTMQAQMQSGNTFVTVEHNIWVRNGKYFIHISRVLPNQVLRNVSVYKIENADKLISVINARQARFVDQRWILEGVVKTRLESNAVISTQLGKLVINHLFPPRLLGLLDIQPESMSLGSLMEYIDYLRDNHLNAAIYELAFWQRLTLPISTLTMLMLALPFVFGSLRSGGTGQRLFVGVLLGLGFYFLNRLSNQLGLVYGLPPFLSASLPIIVFTTFGLLGLRRVH